MMQVVCAWCKDDLGFKQGPEGEVSHGICQTCQEQLHIEYHRLSLCKKLAVMVGFVLWLLLMGAVGECDYRDKVWGGQAGSVTLAAVIR